MNYLVLLAVAALALSAGVESACPSNATLIRPCLCSELENGFNVTCPTTYYTDNIQNAIRIIGDHGPIVSLQITGIFTVFDYVANDIFSGHDIPDVTFLCSHGFYGSNPPLSFNIFAFKSAQTGKCTLTGRLLIKECRLKHFYGEIFNGCDKLESIEFRDNYLNDFSRLSRLDNLKSLIITSKTYWMMCPDHKLRAFEITALPSLKYLDLSYSSLRDQHVEFISQLTTVEEVYLKGRNNLTAIPDLSNLSSLRVFDISFNEVNPNLNISLPVSRKSQSLSFVAKANYSNIDDYTYISGLKGDFNGVDMSLLFPVEYLNESVFYEPLSRMDNGNIVLSSESSLTCKCDLSWLIRDHPHLLQRIDGGVCVDGKPIHHLPADKFKCCPIDTLVNRNEQQELKIHELEDENKQLKLQLEARL